MTAMLTAAMLAASMSFAVVMVVMVAFRIGVISKIPCNKAFHRFIGVTADAAEQLNSVLC